MSKTDGSRKSGDGHFDMKADALPPRIAEAALTSGNFPYDKRMKRAVYETRLRDLQIELQHATHWIKSEGARVAVVFEGRDTAGKGGAIARLTRHLNPRMAHVVALSKPSEAEAGQWYFQRYIDHMPTAGEIAIFDRSWYNRAGVEPVFGFCTPAQTRRFLDETPELEAMLTRDGIILIKLFLTIGREMQMKRLYKRWHDPLNQWKISAIDAQAIEKWDDYSQAYETMLTVTDRPRASWTIIRANDKKRARLAVMQAILRALPYAAEKDKKLGEPDEQIILDVPAHLKAGGEG